jgi:hypothetical protein
MPADQWAQYAEKAPPAGSDPWAKYAQPEAAPNAGLAPPAGPSKEMHESLPFGDPNTPPNPPLSQTIGDIGKGFIRNLGQISAPGIAGSILHARAPGLISQIPKVGPAIERNLTPAKELPAQIIENATLAGAGGIEAAPETELAARPSPPSSIVPPIEGNAAPGVAMRVGKVLAHRIPGVTLASDLADAVRGPEVKPGAPVNAPIPETNGIPWGTGGKGPLDLRGQKIQSETIPAPATPAARITSPIEAPKVDTGKLGNLLNESLGGKPLQKGVSLRNQKPLTNLQQQITDAAPPSAQTPKAPLTNLSKQIADAAHPLPEGFTPVESSVLKGYKYDPAKQEFSAITNTGQRYTHAEVTPEEARAFESSDSKGTDWNKQIRQNHVQVEKNGRPTQPIAQHSALPTDLTQTWQDAADDLKAKKAAKKISN